MITTNGLAMIDDLNISNGVVYAEYKGNQCKKVKFRVEKGNQQQTFALEGVNKIRAFPLCFGDGEYLFSVFENIQDKSYKVILSKRCQVKLKDYNSPYVRPNVFCDYNDRSDCMIKAKEITKGYRTNIEKATAINSWIKSNIKYDKAFYQEIKNGNYTWWIPNPDEVFKSKKSICWGIASLMAAMCRSVGIPTRICVGYKTDIYHAWNEIYTDEAGLVDGFICNPGKWTRLDLSNMITSNSAGRSKININSNYKVDYLG